MPRLRTRSTPRDDRGREPTAAVVIAAVLLVWVSAAPGRSESPERAAPAFAADRYLEHVKFLSSDDLAGRGNGSAGLDRAARYIADEFRAARLAGGGDEGFFQPFEVDALSVERGNRLTALVDGRSQELELGRDYFPVSILERRPSTVAQGVPSGVEGRADSHPIEPDPLPVVFAGYGVSAPDLGYDDYAGLDVDGAAVLVFTHVPREGAADQVFGGAAGPDRGSIRRKIGEARARGARLLLVVEDPSHGEERLRYRDFLSGPQAGELGLPVLRVRRAAVSRLLAGRIDVEAAAAAIDATLTPQSLAAPGVQLRYAERYARARREVRNVIGVMPGTEAGRAPEAIVVGAHYDHLGLGARFSMAPDAAGEVHNGADDNASGTAALLEIAHVAAANRRAFPRTLVFVAFAGEELGLLGSAQYVARPTVPLDRTVAMINLDMIGRPRGRILISGLRRAPGLEPELRAAQAGISLEVEAFSEGPGVGSSDDTSFLTRDVPAIGFFSGFHDDYHRPSDDWDRLDVAGSLEVAALAYEFIRRIAERTEPVELVGLRPLCGADQQLLARCRMNGGAHSAPARERSGASGPPRATEPGFGAEPRLIMPGAAPARRRTRPGGRAG